MKVLVVGGGGREHALAWKLGLSPRVEQVFVAPGNAGTAIDAKNLDIAATDKPAIIAFAKSNQIDLVVVGPEAPLVDGLVDDLEEAGILTFGPSAEAAELEGSKVFCKNLLHTANIPTAGFQAFRRGEDASRYIKDRYPEPSEPVPVVVKADGLAAGKGVIVCDTREEALDAIERICGDREFGDAGNSLIIEEKLVGQEASVLAITDGETIVTLPAAQDHKPAYDGDKGPNTGGMGAYCPTPIIDEEMMQKVEEEVLVPIVHAMKRARKPFKGVLYAGLMLTPAGPKVLEFNARFGDPECQPLLMRLKTDLFDILEAAAKGKLSELAPLEWDDRPSLCVVMASEGYPGSYEKGRAITGLEAADAIEDVKVFHAGTRMAGDKVVNDVGDYLDGERNAKRKYEYVHGVVYAMAGANNLQNRIASNAKSGFGITLALGSTILTYRLFVIQTAIQIRNAINRLS
jgi:phosphoribosylamine--glycine ligase